MVGRLEDDIAAAPAVAAVRPAKLHERLAPERHRAVAALARPDENLDLIYECLRLHAGYFTIFRALIGTPLQDRSVCLPMWDLLRVICWLFSVALCWFAFQRAVTVGATVLPAQGGRFARPSPHSAYTYTPSGASPAQLASPCFGPLSCGPDRDRAWHLWSSSSRNIAPRPRSHSPRRLSRRLHGVTRRNASSAEYRLLALRRVPPRC